MEWKTFLINQCPDSVYYIPDFINPHEEAYLLSQVSNTPKPRWTQLSHRRLINYGGIPHPKGMIAESMPPWLQSYVDKINQLNGVFEVGKQANHVLVNEYLPGQGIMAHSDGPLFHPTITTISCGSYTVLEFYEPLESDEEKPLVHRIPIAKLLIEPRSLLILKDNMYRKYLHAISEVEQDHIDEKISNLSKTSYQSQTGAVLQRSTRISFTIRHVPKTSKMKIKLF